MAQRSVSGWRYFPHAMLGALGVVMAVNGGMVWSAIRTFPGATAAGFAESNRYQAVLARAAQEAALGWRVDLAADGAALRVTGADGAPLSGATVQAEARRPVGADHLVPLRYVAMGDGGFRPEAPLPLAGQWDVTLTITRGTDALHTTRRVVVR